MIDIDVLSSLTERGLPLANVHRPKVGEYRRDRGLLPPITDECPAGFVGEKGCGPAKSRLMRNVKR